MSLLMLRNEINLATSMALLLQVKLSL
jgi:hypothetical protein